MFPLETRDPKIGITENLLLSSLHEYIFPRETCSHLTLNTSVQQTAACEKNFSHRSL